RRYHRCSPASLYPWFDRVDTFHTHAWRKTFSDSRLDAIPDGPATRLSLPGALLSGNRSMPRRSTAGASGARALGALLAQGGASMSTETILSLRDVRRDYQQPSDMVDRVGRLLRGA